MCYSFVMAIKSQLLMLQVWYDDEKTDEPSCWGWHDVLGMGETEDVWLISADPPTLD